MALQRQAQQHFRRAYLRIDSPVTFPSIVTNKGQSR
jgi:hypothetical protein